MDERDPASPGGAIALTGGIEQTQCIRIIAYHHSDRVVIKHLRETVKIFSVKTYRWPFSLTVGTYSLGNLFVVYEIRRQV
jgi:hypothetical protein